MINISKPTECCGCNACVQACPQSCISFGEDKEGFRYPHVDLDQCINCNRCEKVCPVLNVPYKQNIMKVYAAIYENEAIRATSSSGAVFSYIAEKVINKGGVIFGAVFDSNWEVRHLCVQNEQDLSKIRGSKYLQSRIEDSYKRTRTLLEDGRVVLFSGTPCQIAGLKKFLCKDYENLICVDFICHGVPSPKIWRLYLKQIITDSNLGIDLTDIKSIHFRSKSMGWSNYSFLISSSNGVREVSHLEDYYNRAFNRNMILRPICYQCPFKGGNSGSDFTLADFWGIKDIDQTMYDDMGTSMVISYGKEVVGLENLRFSEESIDCIRKYNASYYESAGIDDNRVVFFGHLKDNINIIKLFKRCITPTLLQRVSNRIYRLTHKKSI